MKKLPEMLEKPLAVIRSDSDPQNSVVIILSTKINGKQIIAPVYVNSNSIRNGLRIDSNNIATVFGKDNTLTKLLTDALNIETTPNKAVGVYYWNKTEARRLYEGAGLQLPGSSIQDGLIHSIFDVGSEVNKKMFLSQTETQQFRRWFGNSVVVNEDGSPKVVYHGTDNEFTVFDVWRTNYGEVSEGWNFFTNKKSGYADSAKDYANRHENGHVMEVYLSIQKPLMVYSDGYFTPVHFYDLNYRDIEIKYLDGDYDGIIIQNHDKSIDDSVMYLVQDPAQIKSATDNVGTFDPENPDIRYSERRTTAPSLRETLLAMEETPDMTATEKEMLAKYKKLVADYRELERQVEAQRTLGEAAYPVLWAASAHVICGFSRYATISCASVNMPAGAIVPCCKSANSVSRFGVSSRTASYSGSPARMATRRTGMWPLPSSCVLRSINARRWCMASVVVEAAALYIRKQPATASDQLKPPYCHASHTLPPTAARPSTVPAVRMTRATTSPRKNRPSSRAISRPPSRGSAGSRFTIRMAAFARNSVRPADCANQPTAVSRMAN